MIGLFIVELDWRRAAQSASLQENIDLTEDSGFYQKKKKKKAVGCGSRSVTPLRAPRLCVSPTLLRDSALQTSPCTSCASKALVAVFRAKKQATSFYACFSNTLVPSHRWPSLTRNTADILRVFEVRIMSKIFCYSLWNSSHRVFFKKHFCLYFLFVVRKHQQMK